ncbi:MAG: hypothetical protein PHP08_01130 [Candidatus Dojkabacteria bacterium]|nr:hypothetical protein [Candidatus Dojkabacteria bacterium]
MKKIFVIIFFVLNIFLPQVAYALEDKFYSTISFSIDEVEDDKVKLYRTPYEIRGEYTDDILFNTAINDLTTNELETRIYNKYERVTVRPLSTVDVGYYWYNNTSEELDIESIRIPLSRQITYRGDLTEILSDIGFEDGVIYTDSLNKGGKYLEVDGVGLISSQSSGSVVIETLTVKLPVEITDYEIEYMSEYTSKVTFTVRSTVSQYLNDVLINYSGSVDIRMDFESYEEFTVSVYKQCDLVGNEVNCGPMRIKNPNIKMVCGIYGSPWSGYINPDSITVFNKIGDDWIVGSRAQPDVESFCITRLPYIYTTEDMIGYIDLPEITDEEYWSDLLDIEILPITSYQDNIFSRFIGLIKPNIVDNLKVL